MPQFQAGLDPDKRFESLFLLAAAQSKNKDALKPEQMLALERGISRGIRLRAD